MNITTTISDRQMADLLCSAFEGGSNYWIHTLHVVKGIDDGRPWGEEYTPSYIRAPFSTDGCVQIQQEDGAAMVVLDRAALQNGAQLMAEKYPRHFADALSESNADATTGDVFLQLCVLGEIVYG